MANRQTRVRVTSSVNRFANDFKQFLLRGNVVELAVAVVLGAAFNAIVTSLVQDIITPVLLQPALRSAGVDDIALLSAGGVKYGVFLAAVINFIVVGLVLFLVVRTFARFSRTEEAAIEPTPTPTEKLDITIQHLTETLERKL
ncbi:large conductance mechanosensitive channel protein [Synechococcus sp. PCC 7335]|uniref:large conductance mechanosensitive channel protein MscL n=1 Tax=Synechococcus sp. (strain ATCC 29403 / PCC 7335) TaxID=91464 RepID=UPI00017ED9B0|nr:large conductance mechanosensitive channel protein MscL [Synechococcus sp. PCC 7335]EDX85344.1 large conductance mechanosensitive channel protein [Synechococcus sp. PCC 7335]